jgi:[ribosomal protein S5]-alanine N-acetyltransferase
VYLQKYQQEKLQLMEFLTENCWPYHVNQTIHKEAIIQTIDCGYYEDDKETFWIIENNEIYGIVILEDISDSIPLIDIRLTEKARGKGLGTKALEEVKNYVFGELKKIRIEGYTRADNVAMRKCFNKVGFVMEGYLRQAWENKDGSISDSTLYAAIRSDWENQTITLPNFHDVLD